MLYPIPHIADCIGLPSIRLDLQYLSGNRELAVSRRERAHAEQLVTKHKFLKWLKVPCSSQLLVQGDYEPFGIASGLSFVCLSLADVLARHSDSFIPLAFFCGMHTDYHPENASQSGGRALIRSLIYQLLGHINRFLGRPGVCMSPRRLHCIHNGDLQALNSLFASLVSMVPPDVTICCVVDGANYYEEDEFWGEAAEVLWPLMELSARKPRRRASFKLLMTSATVTSYLRQRFQDESMVFLANTGSAKRQPSIARVEREIAQAIHMESEEDMTESEEDMMESEEDMMDSR